MMFNLNFDELFEHFHAILTEIQPFEVKICFCERRKMTSNSESNSNSFQTSKQSLENSLNCFCGGNIVSCSMIFFNYTLCVFFVHAFNMVHCSSKLNPQGNSSALRSPNYISKRTTLLCLTLNGCISFNIVRKCPNDASKCKLSITVFNRLYFNRIAFLVFEVEQIKEGKHIFAPPGRSRFLYDSQNDLFKNGNQAFEV